MNLGRIPAKTALLDPEREALIDIPNDRRMTFGTLDERVRRLANGLCNQLKLSKGDGIGLGPNHPITSLQSTSDGCDLLLFALA